MQLTLFVWSSRVRPRGGRKGLCWRGGGGTPTCTSAHVLQFAWMKTRCAFTHTVFFFSFFCRWLLCGSLFIVHPEGRVHACSACMHPCIFLSVGLHRVIPALCPVVIFPTYAPRYHPPKLATDSPVSLAPRLGTSPHQPQVTRAMLSLFCHAASDLGQLASRRGGRSSGRVTDR